jgi:hypothetical protein
VGITNKYEALTPEAQDFQKEVEAAVRPLIEANHDKFTYREMAYLVSESIAILTAELAIRNAMEMRKRERDQSTAG